MKINKVFLIDSLGWGVALWLFGYILGILLFGFVPKDLLGWVITPFGIGASLWVLFTRVKSKELSYYFILGALWVILAVALDYIFWSRLLTPLTTTNPTFTFITF